MNSTLQSLDATPFDDDPDQTKISGLAKYEGIDEEIRHRLSSLRNEPEDDHTKDRQLKDLTLHHRLHLSLLFHAFTSKTKLDYAFSM